MTPHTFNLICAIFYVGLTLMVGYTILCGVIGASVRHWAQVIGASFALGAGGIAFILFDFSIAGVKPHKSILIVTAIVTLTFLGFFWRKHRLVIGSVPSPWRRPDALTVLGGIALLALIAASLNVSIFASWPGLNDIDVFGIWLFKAKWVSLSALHPIPPAFFSPDLSYTHQDYPLGLPFFVAGLYSMVGSVDESIAKVLCFPIYLSLTSMMYAALRSWHRRSLALAITALFATAPTLCHNAGLLVGETFLIMSLTGAATSIVRWIQTNESSDLILTMLFSTTAAFSKNEGVALLPVFALTTLAVAITRRQPKRWLKAALIAAAVITPWLIFRIHLPKTHEDYGGKLSQPAMLFQHRDRIVFIVKHYFPELFNAPNQGITYYVLIVAAGFSLRTFARPAAGILWLICIIQLLLYSATFLVTPWSLSVLLPMIAPKLITQASPLVVLLIGLHLREIRWTGSDNSTI